MSGVIFNTAATIGSPMKKKKITRLLKVLNDRELDRFGLFLDSPYYSGDAAVKKYFLTLRSEVIHQEKELAEEEFYRRTFPGENFDNKHLARLGSVLVSLLYKFFAAEFLEHNDLRSWSIVLDALEQRRQEEPLTLTLSAMERALKRAPESAERLLQQYRLLEIQASRSPGSGRQGRHVTDNEIQSALDEYYLLARLRLDCSSLNRGLVFGKSSRSKAEKPAPEPSNLPSLADLYRLVRVNLEDPSNFDCYSALAEALSTVLESQKGPLSFDMREICRYALNGCVRLLNLHPGKREPREMLRRLYDEQLEAGVMFENKLLPPWHFKNMIQNLVLLGDAEGAKARIEEFKDRLLNDYQENAVVFGRGYISFHTGDFDAARRHFNHLLNDFKDVFYGLDGRVMLLRSLFELGEVVALQYQQDAARVYLHRLKGSRAVSESHLNLYREAVRNISKLGTIYFGAPDKREERLAKFSSELEGQETVMHRDWFLKKAGK